MNPDEIARQKADDDYAKDIVLEYLENGDAIFEDIEKSDWEKVVPKNVRERAEKVRALVEKNDPNAKVERQLLEEKLNSVGPRGLNQEIEAASSASKKDEKKKLDDAILAKNKERKDLFQKGFLMAVASGAKNFDDAVEMVKKVYSPFVGGDTEKIADDIRKWISDSEWMEKAFLTPTAYKPLNRGLANTALKENLSVDEMDEMIKREAQYFARQKDLTGIDTYINPSNARSAALGNEKSKWNTVRDLATFGPRLAGSFAGYVGSAALDRMGFPNAAQWLEEATAVDNPDKLTNDITMYIPGTSAGKVGRALTRTGRAINNVGGRLPWESGSRKLTSIGEFFEDAGKVAKTGKLPKKGEKVEEVAKKGNNGKTIPQYIGEGVADIAIQVPVDNLNETAHGNVETGVGVGIGKALSSAIEGGLHVVTSANPEYNMLAKRAKEAADKNGKRTVINGADGEVVTTGGIFTDGNGVSYIQTEDGKIYEYVPKPSEDFNFKGGMDPRTRRFRRYVGTTEIGAEVPETFDTKTTKANAALLKWLKLNPSDLRKQDIDPNDLSILFEEGLIKPGDTPYDIALRVEQKVDELNAQRNLARRAGRADPIFLERSVGPNSQYTADAMSEKVRTRLANLLDEGVIDSETYEKMAAKADDLIRRYFPDIGVGSDPTDGFDRIRPMEIQGLINSFQEKENKFFAKLNTREARTPEEIAEHEIVDVFKDVNRDLYDVKKPAGVNERIQTPEQRRERLRAERGHIEKRLKRIEEDDSDIRKKFREIFPDEKEPDIDDRVENLKESIRNQLRDIDNHINSTDLQTVEQNLVDEWKATTDEYSKWLGLNRAMQNKKGAWLNDSFGIHGTTAGNGLMGNVPKSRAGLLKKGGEQIWNNTVKNIVPVPSWTSLVGENFNGRPFTAEDILKMYGTENVFRPNVFENWGKAIAQEVNDKGYDMPSKEPRTVGELFGDAIKTGKALVESGAKKADEAAEYAKSGGAVSEEAKKKAEEAKKKAEQDLETLNRKERVRREEPKGKSAWKRAKPEDEIRLQQKNIISQDELDFLNAVASSMGGYVDGRQSFTPGAGFTIE